MNFRKDLYKAVYKTLITEKLEPLVDHFLLAFLKTEEPELYEAYCRRYCKSWREE